MIKSGPLSKNLLPLLVAVSVTLTAKAQYSSYFTNQRFGSASTTTTGSFNGGTYSLTNPSGATITTFTSAPGSLPAGAGYPTTGPTGPTLNSSGAAATSTFSFSTPLTPADHIYIEDVDNEELASFTFYDASSNIINPAGFVVNKISGNFNPAFTITKTSTKVDLYGGVPTVTEPLLEIIPDAPVSSFRINYTNPNGGGFAVFFGRNIPILTQALSGSTITRGRSLKLTYTLSGINNNPIAGLGFVNALPSGWKVASVPAATGTLGTLVAAPNGSGVTLSGVNSTFAQTSGSTTWSVDVSNADGQMNSSCGTSPVAFSNRLANFTTSSTVLNNNVSAVCFTVTAPLPLELTSFSAVQEDCAIQLRWETAYEESLAGYRLERSADGQRWSSIGFLEPANGRIAKHYSFRDAGAPQGNLQYRLRIADLDGTYSSSPVAAVRLACGEATQLAFAPNPASTAVSCNLGTAPAAGARVRMLIADLAGRTVAVVPAQSLSGTVAQFSLPLLTPGLYLVQASVDGQAAGAGKLSIR